MYLFCISCILFTYLQIKLFNYILYCFPFATTKQKAHILSCINSLIMSIYSIYINIKFFFNDFIAVGDTINIQILILSFFTSYLLCDISIGVFYYKQYLGILTGYIHHFLYICINIYAILSNNTLIYSLYFVSEIPTFILCIGNLISTLRMDKIFGFTFLFTRIIYHSFLILIYYIPSHIFPNSVYFSNDGLIITTFLASSILILHLHWFRNWFIKYF